jgi:hypothetical protein
MSVSIASTPRALGAVRAATAIALATASTPSTSALSSAILGIQVPPYLFRVVCNRTKSCHMQLLYYQTAIRSCQEEYRYILQVKDL